MNTNKKLISLAVMATLGLGSSCAIAENFTQGLILDNETKNLSENSKVTGPLDLTGGSVLNLNGEMTLKVEGCLWNDPDNLLDTKAGIFIDSESQLLGKDAILEVNPHYTRPNSSGDFNTVNLGTLELKRVEGSILENAGTVILHEDSKFHNLSNLGTLVTNTGVLQKVEGGSVFANYGKIQSNSGTLHIVGTGLQMESSSDSDQIATIVGPNGAVLENLMIDNLLFLGMWDDGVLTVLEAKEIIVGTTVKNNALLKAETLKADSIENIADRWDEFDVQIIANDIYFTDTIKNKKEFDEGIAYAANLVINNSLNYTGDGTGVIENAGNIYMPGENAVITGDIVLDNTVDETIVGLIAKNAQKEKIENLIVSGTFNNEGEVYAKNLSVKNGYDGTNDADSAAFDVDNLTVMEAGEFALNSTSTDLQTVTISKDATLTANKTVNLSGAASVSNNGGTATFGEVNSENLNVYGTSGQTTITKARMSNQVGVTLDSGTVTIDDLETQKLDVTINNLEGNKLDVAKVNDDVNASVTVSSQANTGAAQDVIDKVMGSVAIGTDNATDVDYLITAKPGLITDGFTTQSNDPMTIHTTKNPTMDAFGSVTALSALTLRHEMNSLSKRMGELRDAPAGVGVWARAYGSEMEYGAQDVKAKNNSVQMGADYTLGDWKVGAAFSYTDGESSYESGKADNKNYGLALYGTWFVPCGAYVDLIAKYTRMDNDFTMGGLDGSFDNDAFNVSAETGYRFNFMDGGVYVEPQVGLSYGYVKGESFAAGQGVTIEQDDYDSFIGRVGVRTGFKFPKDKGTIYARVSGVYDFNGEVNARAYNASASNTIESDMGGAWLEMGVGANFNWTKNTYTYIDFERTNGGDVKENYRWNVGVRHTF